MLPVCTLFRIRPILLIPHFLVKKDRKILDMLPDRPPQVTFSCDATATPSTCDFQFWTAQVESFYCHLDDCTSDTQVSS